MVKQMKGQYKVASPGLRPLWEEARRLAGKLERFEMRHTLRGGNKEADQLANDAMDKGMGREPAAPGNDVVRPKSDRTNPAHKPASSSAPRQVIEGYVKGGVVHLLEGDLPDGTFVNVIPK
jgi:probable phosphoglycerate mutase